MYTHIKTYAYTYPLHHLPPRHDLKTVLPTIACALFHLPDFATIKQFANLELNITFLISNLEEPKMNLVKSSLVCVLGLNGPALGE